MAEAVAVVLVAAHGLLPSADLQRLLTVAASASSARFGQLPDTTRLVTYLQDQWDGERRFPWCRSGTVAAFPKPPCGTLASCAARR